MILSFNLISSVLCVGIYMLAFRSSLQKGKLIFPLLTSSVFLTILQSLSFPSEVIREALLLGVIEVTILSAAKKHTPLQSMLVLFYRSLQQIITLFIFKIQFLLFHILNAYVLTHIISLLLCGAVFVLLGRKIEDIQETCQQRDLIISSAIVTLIFTVQAIIFDSSSSIILHIAVILAAAAVVYLCIHMILLQGMIETQQFEAQSLAVSTDSIKELEHSIRKEEKKRHNLIHELTLINQMLSNGNLDEAQKTITALNNDLDQAELYTYSRNAYVNAMIEKTIENHLGFNISVNSSIGSETVIPTVDLAVAVSALLEQIIDFLEKHNLEKKAVLELKQRGDMVILILHISIDHMYSEEELLPKTIRTAALRSLLQRYRGIMRTQCTDQTCTITLLMNGEQTS